MDQENNNRPTGEEIVPAEQEKARSPEQRKPYSKKARAWAWVGIAFMVFLTIMYFYVFFSGKILLW